ncbi:phage minor capsid protein [Eubacterium maltosivorans]|uniref:Minor capsid protein n=1 Tax=Eubacterium maltosivorans TaxID=2041044 RepID=A0A4P9C623_EUBML|nr:phage minor capsid protein [Eubacterium maltosivorans]QCT70837.1 hypothetical protein CPZ25_005670 [Eubacterium maltosivorans]
MLTPAQYDLIADSMTGLFQDLEDFIIQDFVRRITSAGTMTETAKWQARRAKEMGLSTEAIRKAVQTALQVSDKQLDYLFEQWGVEMLKPENTALNALGKKAVDVRTHEELSQIFEAILHQTKGEIRNITGSLGFAERVKGKIVFKPIAKYFQDQMDFVQLQVQSGALDYNSAVRQAIKKMADSGLRTVDYASGWSNHLDVAARRATLTGANQLSGQMTDALGEETGCNFVEVTAHAGARNTGSGPANHAGWQGKVYCRKGSTKEYPNLYQATGLGTGEGLKGWNCRHDYNNFWPGISKRTWTDKELKNIDPEPIFYKGRKYDHYTANQHQREIERSIRKTKRELIGYNAADDTEAFTTASVRLRRQKKEYQTFSRAADLRIKPERHQVYQFDRSISQKAIQAERNYWKQLAEKQKGAIIKSRKTRFFESHVGQHGASENYKAAIKDRFDNGTRKAKRVFQKYVPTDSIGSGTQKGVAHYSPKENKVYMNFAADERNPKGAGVTYFHEHGHYIDHATRINGQSRVELSNALKADYKQYLKDYQDKHHIKYIDDVRSAISKEISDNTHSAVSDLFGGMSGNKCVGSWCHRKSYWKSSPDKLPSEAFAHFFEAQFNEERRKVLEHYFPSAMKEFKKILGGL